MHRFTRVDNPFVNTAHFNFVVFTRKLSIARVTVPHGWNELNACKYLKVFRMAAAWLLDVSPLTDRTMQTRLLEIFACSLIDVSEKNRQCG